MIRPYFNVIDRNSMINNSFIGANLKLRLEILKLQRDCNFIEWFYYKRLLNKLLRESIKFKGWD